jgi:hypothetical protein
MTMATIHHLEVHLEVEGDDEEAAFVRLFEKHINRWCRLRDEQEERRRYIEDARRLGDDRDGDAD